MDRFSHLQQEAEEAGGMRWSDGKPLPLPLQRALERELGKRQRPTDAEIARKLGINRSTVGRYRKQPRKQTNNRPASRCKGCGGLVATWPCLVCTVRRIKPR